MVVWEGRRSDVGDSELRLAKGSWEGDPVYWSMANDNCQNFKLSTEAWQDFVDHNVLVSASKNFFNDFLLGSLYKSS
jgi:hypothetical protein